MSTSQKRIQFMFQSLVVLVRQMTPQNSKHKQIFIQAVRGKPKRKEQIQECKNCEAILLLRGIITIITTLKG